MYPRSPQPATPPPAWPPRLRPETLSDYADIWDVHAAAFERTAEAALVSRLRENGRLLVSLVAEWNGKIVGHVAFSPATITTPKKVIPAVALGPVGVLPPVQRLGIGALLIQAGIAECRRQRHSLLFVLGHPTYYPRFGFRPSKPLGLAWEHDVPADLFMVLELRPGALRGLTGIVRFSPEFAGEEGIGDKG